MTDRQEAFPLNDRIDDALSYLGDAQGQVSSAKREAYRLLRERDSLRTVLLQALTDLEERGGPCSSTMCPGLDQPPVDGMTCTPCYVAHDLRAALTSTTGHES